MPVKTKTKQTKPAIKAYTFDHNRLAAALLKKRYEDVISQRDAAKQIGISQPQFYKMELGHENVSVIYFLKACTWLKMPVDTFINH